MQDQNADASAQQARDNETALRADQRFEYSAIVDRAPLKLPRGARMIVWPVVNIAREWRRGTAMTTMCGTAGCAVYP